MTELATLEDLQNVNEYSEATNNTTEWLSFKLDNSDYAFDILRVREIRTWEKSTRIPFSSDSIVGLINLRGAIVPIIDLRKRFELDSIDYHSETVVLIVDVRHEDMTKAIGVIVDAISDVVSLDIELDKKELDFDLALNKRFVKGIANDGSKMLILLEIDTILDSVALSLSSTQQAVC